MERFQGHNTDYFRLAISPHAEHSHIVLLFIGYITPQMGWGGAEYVLFKDYEKQIEYYISEAKNKFDEDNNTAFISRLI